MACKGWCGCCNCCCGGDVVCSEFGVVYNLPDDCTITITASGSFINVDGLYYANGAQLVTINFDDPCDCITSLTVGGVPQSTDVEPIIFSAADGQLLTISATISMACVGDGTPPDPIPFSDCDGAPMLSPRFATINGTRKLIIHKDTVARLVKRAAGLARRSGKSIPMM